MRVGVGVMTMRGVLVVCLLLAVFGVGIHAYPARKLDLAEELLNEEIEGDSQNDEVESKVDDAVGTKKEEIAGSGSAAARKDEVAETKTIAEEKKEDPESDESDSPASGDEDTSGDDSTDAVASGNNEEDAGSKRKRAIPDEEDEEKDDEKFSEEENGSGSDDGSTSSSESEDKGQEAEVKKTKVTNVCGSKRCDCEWEKEDDKDHEGKKEEKRCDHDCDEDDHKPEKEENSNKRCECECEEEDEPEEEHEHCHKCHGHEQGCHGCHEDEHHHCDDHGHHEHDDCCHHHGHHHGFVHEWGEECCGDHNCHDCCGEHEHEHHDEGDHHHEHCCHDNHCCHHKEEEEGGHKRSVIATGTISKPGVPASPMVKKQTVHVGYGYASGDNYRLGYQQGGMGGLASTFTGQIGAEQQGSYDAADHYNKRQPSYQPGPIREKRFYGGHAFGNLESGIAHGSATPYGHPVTHPGFTTMGFPGHALASQDVRARISHPQMKRSIVYEEDEYPYVGYTWSLPYELATKY